MSYPSVLPRPLALLGLLALAAVASDAAAQCTNTWQAPSGGAWTTVGGWSAGRLPNATDAVCFVGGTYAVEFNTSAAARTLTLGASTGTVTLRVAGGRLALGDSSTVGAGGALEVTGGTLAPSGGLRVATRFGWTGGAVEGRLHVAPGARADLDGGGDKSLIGATLTNDGTVRWTDGTFYLQFASVLDNRGTFEPEAVRAMARYGPDGRLVNTGVVRRGAAGAVNLNVVVDGRPGGRFEAVAGTVQFTYASRFDGVTLTAAAGAGLAFTGGATHTVAGRLTGDPAGAVVLDGATLTPEAAGATLDFTNEGFRWRGGNVTNGGPLTNAGRLVLDGGADKVLAGTRLVNTGTAEWRDGTFYLQFAAVFENRASFFADAPGRALARYGPDGRLINTGTVVRRRAGAVNLNAVVENGGTIRADSGLVQLTHVSVHDGATLTAAAPGEVRLDGGTHTLAGALGGAPAGRVVFASGTLRADPAGTLGFGGTGLLWTGGTLTGPGVTTNAGLVVLDGGADKSVVGATLVNTGTLDWRQGTFYLQFGAVLDNRASFFADAPGRALARYGADGRLVNTGTVTRRRAGAVNLNAVVENAGVIRADSGLVQLTHVSRHDGSTLDAAAGAEVRLESGTHVVRRLGGSPAGRVAFASGTVRADSAGGTVAFSGTGLAWMGGTVAEGGVLTNDGLLVLDGGADKSLVRARLVNAGTLRWHDGTFYAQFGAVVENAGTFTTDGARTLARYGDDGLFVNLGTFRRAGAAGTTTVDTRFEGRAGSVVEGQAGVVRFTYRTRWTGGRVDAAAGAEVRLDGGTHTVARLAGAPAGTFAFTGGTLLGDASGGVLDVGGAGLVWTGGQVTDGGPLTNAGRLVLDGPTDKSVVRGRLVNAGTLDWRQGTFYLQFGAVLDNAGTFRLAADGRTLARYGDAGRLVNTGTVRLDAPSATVDVPFVNGPAGRLDVGTGALRLGQPFVNEGGGRVEGAGTLDVRTAPVTNAGAVAPGPGVATLRWLGALDASAGLTEVELGPAGRSDTLVVSGTATLGGVLLVTLAGGYTPAIGDRFTVLRTGGVVGRFDAVRVYGPPGVTFEPAYTSEGVTLTAVAGEPSTDLYVTPARVRGGGVRSFTALGAGFDAATTVRVVCDGCADPDGHGAPPAAVVARTPDRLTFTVDLSDGDVFGPFRVEVAGGGAGAAPLVVLPAPLRLALSVPEPDAAEDGRVPGRFRLTANRRLDSALVVRYTLGGTAGLFDDFTTDGPRGQVIFAKGARTADVRVLPLQDAEDEPAETVEITVAATAAFDLDAAPAVVTIADGRSPAAFFVVSSVPGVGGNGGPVTVRAVGQGFVPGAALALRGPAGERPGTHATLSASRTVLTAAVDLAGAPVGTYDLVVTNGDGARQTLPAAFTVEPAKAPDLFLSVTGPARFRAGQVSPYTVTVTNRGNVDAYAVPVWVSLTKGSGINVGVLEPRFRVLDLTPPPSGSFPGWSGVPLVADTLGRLTMGLLLPVVPAGESVTLAFRARTYFFEAWTTQPLLNGLGPDASGTPALGKLMAGAVDPDALENCLLNIGTLALDFIPGLDCAQSAVSWLGSATANLYGAVSAASRNDTGGAVGNVGQMGLGLVGMALECAGSLSPWGLAVKYGIKTFSVINTALACNDLLNKKPGPNKESESLASSDPNDKTGPAGFGVPRYTTRDDPFGYLIRFENKAEASAPAAEVVVEDTLDAARFDLSTFALGPIAWGDSLIAPPPGLASYAAERPLPNGLRLLVAADLDRATGRVVWRFTTLDPQTREVPADPLLGFLPPNRTAPEGEGSVFFTVRPKATLPSGTTITNRARIFFDLNEPIDTPPWANTLDAAAPASRVAPLAATQPDSTFTVRWGGSDGGAGVVGYDVYVAEDGGPFRRWLLATTDTAAAYPGRRNGTYAFFSRARDGAGNLEPPKTTAEAATSVAVGVAETGGLPTAFALHAPAPNPTRDAATFRFDVPRAGRVRLDVYDVVGRRVATVVDEELAPGRYRRAWRPDALAAGLYFARLRADGFHHAEPVTVVR